MSLIRSTTLACAIAALLITPGHAQKTRPSEIRPSEAQPSQTEAYQPSYADLRTLGATEQHLHCVSFLSLMRNFISPSNHSDTIDPPTLETMLDGLIRQMFHSYAADHPEVEATEIYDILTAMTVDINRRYQERFSHNMRTIGRAWDESMLTNEYAFCGTLWASGDQ